MKINRKKIIITVFFIVLALVAIWFFFWLNKQEKTEIVQETKNLFPFGKVETGDRTKNTSNQATVGQEDKNQTQDTTEVVTEPKEVAGPRLRQISDFPTGGFAPMIKTEDKEVTDITINAEGISSQTIKTIQVENTYVRYSAIKDATLYESKITPGSITKELMTENYIPNAEHVTFSEDGSRAIFQYWNRDERVIETYLGKIKKIELEVKQCPYDFSKPIRLKDKGEYVLGIHEFLNKNPQTRISVSGINSPGNEGSVVVSSTITAIKNFQSLYELDIDGQIGSTTAKKMLELCNLEQKKIAEKKFSELDTKYDISGFFLPQKITSISIKPKGDEFFYIQEDKAGVIGIVRNLINNSKKTIFESPYTEWISIWNNDKNIELTTKASYQSEGYSYNLNPNDGDYHKSLKQRAGLTTLASPDNKKLFIHEVVDDIVRSSIYDRELNIARPLIIQTFPEKCTWSKDSKKLYCAVPNSLAYGVEYPDTWYQGLETYVDSLWEIDTETFETIVLSDLPTEFQENIDVVKIGIDRNSEYLYFIDKRTEFLWSYRLQDY